MSDSKSVRPGAKIYEGRGCSRRSMIGRAISGYFIYSYYHLLPALCGDHRGQQAAGTLLLERAEDY